MVQCLPLSMCDPLPTARQAPFLPRCASEIAAGAVGRVAIGQARWLVEHSPTSARPCAVAREAVQHRGHSMTQKLCI